MSRSNGPGVPPNGWPADYPADTQNPYPDPYYAPPQQPAQPPQQQRPAHTQPVTQPAARPARIQTAAPSRTPQPGLPAGGLPPQGYAPPPGQGYPPAYPQQTYVPPQQQQPAQQPQYAPQQYAQPQYAPQPPQYAPQAPQQYAPQARPTQPPADPRYAGYQSYDPASVPVTAPTRPTAPPSQYQQPGYAPQPQATPQGYPAASQAYVPEQPQTQPPQPARQLQMPDQWPAAPTQRTGQPAVDPHGYDLGNYMPSAPQQAPEPRTQRPTGSPTWSPNGEPPQSRTQPPGGRDQDYGRLVHGGGLPAQYAPEPQQALEPVADEYDEEDEYEDPPQRTRYGLIAASLLGAIAVGGGLAFAFKTFVAPPAQQVAGTPLVKGTAAPAKVKPAEPGGTKFADQAPKLNQSLSDSQSASSDGGPRAVPTYKVEKDGTITASATGEPLPAAPSASGGPSVPGLIIAGLPPPRQAAPPAAVTPPAAQPLSVQPLSVQPPPARSPPKAAAVPPAAAPEAADEAVAPPPPAPKKVAVKKPVAAPATGLGGPPVTTGSSGFVAVLASVPASGTSKLQAMQQFADLQQKFSGVLGAKSPDVVEATVKNTPYHRLVVGPPASRDAAGQVCAQLKAAGYTADCWVTGF